MVHLNELASKFTVHRDVFMTKFIISKKNFFKHYHYLKKKKKKKLSNYTTDNTSLAMLLGLLILWANNWEESDVSKTLNIWFNLKYKSIWCV